MTIKDEAVAIMTPQLPDNSTYDVYQQFNIDRHAATYVNYLEVIVRQDGKVEYAVPSHQEKLIAIAMEKFNKTRDEISAMCPEDKYFDFMSWLCDITDCISVWNMAFEGKPNAIQTAVLEIFKERGLYTGSVPIL